MELLHQLVTGQYVEPTKRTLGAFLERWLRDYVATNLAPSAAKRYAGIVRQQIIPQLARSRFRTCAPRTSWPRSATG